MRSINSVIVTSDSDRLGDIKGDWFTPYNPESPSLQTGDEGDFKSKDKEKPRPLGWGYTGFTVTVTITITITNHQHF
jgi:hypothetical protein